MTRMQMFQDKSEKCQAKWHSLVSLVTDETFAQQNGSLRHPEIWRVIEIAHIVNFVNEREEVFMVRYKTDGKWKKRPRHFEATSTLMRNLTDASMTNGSNAVFDLEYRAPKFGECGYIIRVNESVPYGSMRHSIAQLQGKAARAFQVVYNLGSKLKDIETAAEELCRTPNLNPWLCVWMSMLHLKYGDHHFDKDTCESMMQTLRVLEKGISERREGDYQDFLGDLLLLPRPQLPGPQ
jgi:hypothetical protein